MYSSKKTYTVCIFFSAFHIYTYILYNYLNAFFFNICPYATVKSNVPIPIINVILLW
jgi:hypothetical protein